MSVLKPNYLHHQTDPDLLSNRSKYPKSSFSTHDHKTKPSVSMFLNKKTQ